MTRHINTLVRMIINILVHVLAWMEYRLRSLASFMWTFGSMVQEVEQEMTPTWRETVWPLCATILGILAIYFVMTVGGD